MTLGGWGSVEAQRHYDNDELVCWIPLLAQLHKQGKQILMLVPHSPSSLGNDTTVPTVKFIRKSWDFMPMDVVRPMATTSVSDVAIMARRLGMVWKTFDPAAGVMRAEGNGHVITSTMYTYTSRHSEQSCWYVPVKGTDKLGFGLVEFDHRLFGQNMKGDLDFSSYAGISSTIPLLRGALSEVEEMLRRLKDDAALSNIRFIPGLNDLIPLCSSLFAIPSEHGEAIEGPWNRIPAPNLYDKGVTDSLDGLKVFETRIQKLFSDRLLSETSASMKAITDGLHCLFDPAFITTEVRDERLWAEMYRHSILPASSNVEMGDVFHAFGRMTDFLLASRIDYIDLVTLHILHAAKSPVRVIPGPLSKEDDAGMIEDPSSKMLSAHMFSYFDFLPQLAEKLIQQYGRSYRTAGQIILSIEEVEDAWLCMMLRAFCWQRLLSFFSRQVVGHEIDTLCPSAAE